MYCTIQNMLEHIPNLNLFNLLFTNRSKLLLYALINQVSYLFLTALHHGLQYFMTFICTVFTVGSQPGQRIEPGIGNHKVGRDTDHCRPPLVYILFISCKKINNIFWTGLEIRSSVFRANRSFLAQK